MCVCGKVDDFGSGFKVTIVLICHTVILSDTYQLTFLGNGARLGLEQIFLCALLNDLGTLLSDYVCMFWRVVAYFNCFQISLKLHIDVVLQSLIHVQLFCDTLDSNPPASSFHRISQAKNTRVGCHFLFQVIFLTQEQT